VRVRKSPPGLHELGRQSPTIFLGGRQVILFFDLVPGENLHPLHLHLEHPPILVGVALDVHVLGSVQATRELLGEPPHPGVDRAGLVHELQREVRRPAAVGTHGRVRG
jgi:hypothetical protein